MGTLWVGAAARHRVRGVSLLGFHSEEVLALAGLVLKTPTWLTEVEGRCNSERPS